MSACEDFGMACNNAQAEAALLQHRGDGDPKRATQWLVDGGFEVLARPKEQPPPPRASQRQTAPPPPPPPALEQVLDYCKKMKLPCDPSWVETTLSTNGNDPKLAIQLLAQQLYGRAS